MGNRRGFFKSLLGAAVSAPVVLGGNNAELPLSKPRVCVHCGADHEPQYVDVVMYKPQRPTLYAGWATTGYVSMIEPVHEKVPACKFKSQDFWLPPWLTT